jgi:putative endonuclease
MEHLYFIYFLTNKKKTVLYIGVTNSLARRVEQHQTKQVPGFTSKYNLTHLIFYESFSDIRDAIAREKQLKGWRREKKEELIATVNPDWNDVDVL